jgi:PiT family inorganic phosphate transporter
MTDLLIPIIALAVVFGVMNGYVDSSSMVATVIASRALSPRLALGLSALAGFLGPFLFGTAVAATVGANLLVPSAITSQALLSALGAAILWNLLSARLGIPSSSTHALIGGLLGAGLFAGGADTVRTQGLAVTLLALFTSPPIGLVAGYLVMRLAVWFSWDATPRANNFFRRGQVLTVFALALVHGGNDGQKSMGVMTLGLLTVGFISAFRVPLWVVTLSALAMGCGSFFGAWRVIRTVGGGIIRIRPIHGFSSLLSSAIVVLAATLAGGPVTSTQVLSTAIMGVGSAERLGKVRWEVGRDLLVSWVLTIPATAAVSAGLSLILRRIL